MVIKTGIIVLTTINGKIIEIVNTGTISELNNYSSLDTIPHDNKKFRELLTEIEKKGYSFSKEVKLKLNGVHTYYFAGSKSANKIVLFGCKSKLNLLRMFDRLSSLKPFSKYLEPLSPIIQKEFEKIDDQYAFLDEQSSIVNELINTQRELSLKNIKIEKERLRYEVTLKNIEEAVISTDRNFCIRFINQRAELLMGISQSNVLNKQVQKVLQLYDENSTEVGFDWFIERKRIIFQDYIALIHKDGIRIPIVGAISILKHQNTVFGYLIALSDISERKEMIEEKERINQLLEILNQILRHDINNKIIILNYVLSELEDKESILYQQGAKALKSIEKIIERVKNIEEAVKEQVKLEVYPLTKIIQEIMGSYDISYQIEGKGKVWGDGAIYSVVQNIVNNAVLHGKAESIKFIIEQEEEHVILNIIDDGKGIKPNIKKQIFEKGFKYGETGNTGLGLYIVQQIMLRYKGSVSVEPIKPKGTNFKLYFYNAEGISKKELNKRI